MEIQHTRGRPLDRSSPRRTGPSLRLRARGAFACFTRPELKTERVSYEVITPSAAVSLFRCVLAKPEFAWELQQIEVLAPIQWTSHQLNEVKTRMSMRAGPIYIEDQRTQRHVRLLRDVDYVLTAALVLSQPRTERVTFAKYEEMFTRRLLRGEQHTAPYFGCRDYAAYLSPAPEPGTYPRIEPGGYRSLGLMFYGYVWPEGRDPIPAGGPPPRPLFFPAVLSEGRVSVPPYSTVLTMNDEGFGAAR